MRNHSYRDSIEIATEILRKAEGGSRKTNIMYGCNLSVSQNVKYLNALLNSGFLALEPDGQYVTTPQGVNAIKTAEKTLRTFNGFHKMLRKK